MNVLKIINVIAILFAIFVFCFSIKSKKEVFFKIVSEIISLVTIIYFTLKLVAMYYINFVDIKNMIEYSFFVNLLEGLLLLLIRLFIFMFMIIALIKLKNNN